MGGFSCTSLDCWPLAGVGKPMGKVGKMGEVGEIG